MKRSLLVTVFAIAFISMLILPAFGWDMGGGGDKQAKMDKISKLMMKKLSLTPDQKALWESLQAARKNFFSLEKAGQKEAADEKKKVFHTVIMSYQQAFGAALLETQPDFAAVGDALKSKYKGEHPDAFAELIDARVAFCQSLNVEQQKKMGKMNEKMKDRMKKHHEH